MLLRTSLFRMGLALAGPAAAQTPQKAIQVIVPFPPGGSADGTMRGAQ
jgi:tripartite-type tricarboxylate transporter receptor subunit TctC